jgi:predicted homoserine dehydrogenase-like protein
MAYGLIENAPITAKQNLLPMGVSEGCRLLRNILKDQPITYADIQLPEGRLCDQLRAQQDRHFGGETRLKQRIKRSSS